MISWLRRSGDIPARWPRRVRERLSSGGPRRNRVVVVAARLDRALANESSPAPSGANPDDDVHPRGPLLRIPERDGLHAKLPTRRSDDFLCLLPVGIELFPRQARDLLRLGACYESRVFF